MYYKKINMMLSIAMIVTTFLPWYSAEAMGNSVSIGGFGTLMGFISFLLALVCLILVLLNKKVALLTSILATASSLISLVLNAAIWGNQEFVETINKMIKADQWSKYLSFGGIVFLLLSIMLIYFLIKDRKKITVK